MYREGELNIGHVVPSSSSSSHHEMNMATLRLGEARPVLVFFISSATPTDTHTNAVMATIKGVYYPTEFQFGYWPVYRRTPTIHKASTSTIPLSASSNLGDTWLVYDKINNSWNIQNIFRPQLSSTPPLSTDILVYAKLHVRSPCFPEDAPRAHGGWQITTSLNNDVGIFNEIKKLLTLPSPPYIFFPSMHLVIVDSNNRDSKQATPPRDMKSPNKYIPSPSRTRLRRSLNKAYSAIREVELDEILERERMSRQEKELMIKENNANLALLSALTI